MHVSWVSRHPVSPQSYLTDEGGIGTLWLERWNTTESPPGDTVGTVVGSPLLARRSRTG